MVSTDSTGIVCFVTATIRAVDHGSNYSDNFTVNTTYLPVSVPSNFFELNTNCILMFAVLLKFINIAVEMRNNSEY